LVARGKLLPKLKERLLGIRISLAGKNCFKVRDFELSGFIDGVAIPAIVKTKNMRRYRKDSWLGDLDSNQD